MGEQSQAAAIWEEEAVVDSSAHIVSFCSLWEGLAVPIGVRYSGVLDMSMVLSAMHIDSGLHSLSILMIIKSKYQYQPTLEDS